MTAAVSPEPAAPSDAERQAAKLLRRQRRNLRKVRAEGYLDGICAMLRPGDLALDCGANLGEITARLAATGAEVIAYDPDPYAFARLTERFDDSANVTLVHAALGVTDGRVRLRRAADFAANPDGASVRSTILDGGRGAETEAGIDVPVLDFPALLARLQAKRGEIAFVKMDIEGAELDILEQMHARDLFQGVRCFVAETHERKFKALRPRFASLRRTLDEAYPPGRIDLDWI